MSFSINKSVTTAALISFVVIVWLLSGIFKDDTPVDQSFKADETAVLPKVLVADLEAEAHPEIIEFFGQTVAERDVTLRAETSGRISDVLVQKGRSVQKGDVLARISMDDRQSRLKSAEALVRQRTLEYDASRKLSQKSFRSQTKLAESEALLHAARAELESIRLEIAHTEIIAPYDGVVDAKNIDIGDYANVGADLFRLITLTPVVVTGEVSEANISSVEEGQIADIFFNNATRLKGIVRFKSMSASDTTRTYTVEVEADSPEKPLAAGQTAKIRLKVGTHMAYQVSPALLSLADDGRIGLRSVDADNRVQFHPIDMIEDTPEGIWVAGLPDKIRLITRGQEYVHEGLEVDPVLKSDPDPQSAPDNPAMIKALSARGDQ